MGRESVINTRDDYTSGVQSPLIVDDADAIDWTDTADVLVIGFGGAGAAAALQARENGATVIAIDRFGGGGATAYSGGVVYAGGTKYQREAGFDDTADEMYKYLDFEGTAVKPETLRRFCETSNGNVEWVVGHGVEFEGSFYPQRTAYPPNGSYLYFSGMEAFHADVAKVAPRGHRTVGNGPTGKFYWAALQKAALDSGIRLKPHSPVRRLIKDRNGRVVGVECQVISQSHWPKHDALYKKVDPYRPFGGVQAEKAIASCRELESSIPYEVARYRASRGVIIAAGNYTYNLELLSRYRPEFAKCYRTMNRGGSMGCDGSGLELGLSAGGNVGNMDAVALMRSVSPPPEYVKGMLVNAHGERYINEDAYLGHIGLATAEQPDYACWLILDSKTFWKGIRQLLHPKEMFSWWGMPAWLNILFGGTKRGSSIEAIARKCGISPDAMRKTLISYNSAVAVGKDQFGKKSDHMRPLHGSFFALNLSFHNKWSFSSGMPFGGLMVNEETGAVVTPDGQPVPGLFACGRSAVGMSTGTTFSGLSIGDTIFSGRRAANAATLSQIEPFSMHAGGAR